MTSSHVDEAEPFVILCERCAVLCRIETKICFAFAHGVLPRAAQKLRSRVALTQLLGKVVDIERGSIVLPPVIVLEQDGGTDRLPVFVLERKSETVSAFFFII